MSDERWMRKNLEGGSRDLMVVPSRHFPGRTEKLNENPHSEYQVFRMGFEASTFRIWVFNAAITPSGSVS
jgi:hypothetical protein